MTPGKQQYLASFLHGGRTSELIPADLRWNWRNQFAQLIGMVVLTRVACFNIHGSLKDDSRGGT